MRLRSAQLTEEGPTDKDTGPTIATDITTVTGVGGGDDAGGLLIAKLLERHTEQHTHGQVLECVALGTLGILTAGLFVALRAEIVGVVFLPTVATVLPHGLEAIAKQM